MESSIQASGADLRSHDAKIQTLETKSGEIMARMQALTDMAGEAGLSDEAASQFEAYDGQLGGIQRELKAARRMREMSADQVLPARVDDEIRPAQTVVVNEERDDPTLLFPGMAMALVFNDHDRPSAATWARHTLGDPGLASLIEMPPILLRQAQEGPVTPAMIQLADPTIGTTTQQTWAKELAEWRRAAELWIEQLRPMSVVLRVAGQRLFSFGGNDSVTIPRKNAGVSGGWVGQGGAIRVERITTGEETMTPKKAATIAVVTNELVARSNPAALGVLGQDFREAIAILIDLEALKKTAAAGAAPGGWFTGDNNNQFTGTTGAAESAALARVSADVQKMTLALDSQNISRDGSWYWIMNPQEITYLQHIRDSLGRFVYQAEVVSGRFFGIPILDSTSQTAGTVGLIAGRQIITGRGRGPLIDSSQDATLHMEDTAPSDDIGGSTSPVRSMYQLDSRALRIIQEIDWLKRHERASALLESAVWDQNVTS